MDFVASHFQFGMLGIRSFQGLVLADDNRILLIPNKNANLLGAGVLGGVAGMLVAGALESISGQAHTGSRETTLGDMSPEDRLAIVEAGTRVHGSWKSMLETTGTRLVILPRDAVKSVRLSIWTGGTIETDLGKIKLLIPLPAMSAARRALETNGWLARR